MIKPSERFEKSITKDNLWIYILYLLKKESLYPYEIKEKIKNTFNFKPGNVTAYVVLKKLKKEGYVEKAKTEKKNGPERTYYKITEKGVAELFKAKEYYKRKLVFLDKI